MLRLFDQREHHVYDPGLRTYHSCEVYHEMVAGNAEVCLDLSIMLSNMYWLLYDHLLRYKETALFLPEGYKKN